MSKIGQEVFKRKKFSIIPASPDHRIYSRGFVIDGKILKKTSKEESTNTDKTDSSE